jgi:hypothetical protein
MMNNRGHKLKKEDGKKKKKEKKTNFAWNDKNLN